MENERSLLAAAVEPLTRWHIANRRPLPWRNAPTAYQVWVSEIMLQQTRIEAVIPYYKRFMERLPDVEALANVSEEELLKLWEGLGYYSRARNLHKAAQLLVSDWDGRLPEDAEALRKLPGIGGYTAGAIASIAFGKPEPAVDGNVLRVTLRLLASREDALSPRTKSRLTALLREVYPSGEAAGLLTEALMELGETVCLPNAVPRCDACPIAHLCLGRERGIAADLPVRAPKKPRKIEERTVLLLQCGERYALRQRPSEGLLANMWELPSLPGVWEAEALAERFGAERAEFLGEAVHLFTHIEWHMRGFRVLVSAEAEGYVWADRKTVREVYAVPAAFRAFLKKL